MNPIRNVWLPYQSVKPFAVFLLSVTIFLTTGCGTQKSPAVPDNPTPGATESGHVQPENGSLEQDDHPATEAARQFMGAMLRGEDSVLRALLTPLARRKGAEQGIPFSPPASDTASFEIRNTTFHGQTGAYVETILTDLDDRGRRESVDIVWIVARTTEGWRIAGAAVALFDGQEKTVINFEDPEAAQQAIADAETRQMRQDRQRVDQAGNVKTNPVY